MLSRPAVIRGLLALSILLIVLFARSGWHRGVRAQQAARRAAAVYEYIEPGMPEYEVEKLFPAPGKQYDGSDWPRTLGEIPGYEAGMPLGQYFSFTPDDPHARLIIPADRKIYWIIWPVAGRHRCIAVAFLYWSSSSGARVVAKTSGLQ